MKQDHVMIEELDGHVTIRIDDYELFDFIDDHLTDHDFEYDYYREETADCRRFFIMHFQVGVDPIRLREVMSSIDPQETQRIWGINN